jgi:prophage maintenance system killer protein
MIKETKKGEIIIYKAQEGLSVQVKFDGDTVWLTLQQIAELFGRDKSVISRHLSAIFTDGELNEKVTVAKNATVQMEGNRSVERQIEYFNLDAVISVGYRVSSKKATQFRIWATSRLRDYLVKGYAINEKRLKDAENLQVKLKELEGAHRLMQTALESKRLEGYEKELLKIIADYANTWFVLNAYDKDDLKIQDTSKGPAKVLDYGSLQKSILAFKNRLMAKKEAGDLFGKEVGGKFQAVLGSIGQTFGGKDLYPSLEEKAAHLLYFCIKDHPFADGNKRIGSLIFLLFLIENNFLMNKKGERKINDTALTALALLVAESKPSDKDAMVKLIVNLINKK